MDVENLPEAGHSHQHLFYAYAVRNILEALERSDDGHDVHFSLTLPRRAMVSLKNLLAPKECVAGRARLSSEVADDSWITPAGSADSLHWSLADFQDFPGLPYKICNTLFFKVVKALPGRSVIDVADGVCRLPHGSVVVAPRRVLAVES